MVDLLKLMEKELSSKPDSKELVSLTKDIFSWYEEGGPQSIEDNLLKHLKEVNAVVSKNIKGITPDVQTRKKKTKKGRK